MGAANSFIPDIWIDAAWVRHDALVASGDVAGAVELRREMEPMLAMSYAYHELRRPWWRKMLGL